MHHTKGYITMEKLLSASLNLQLGKYVDYGSKVYLIMLPTRKKIQV